MLISIKTAIQRVVLTQVKKVEHGESKTAERVIEEYAV